VDPVAFYSGADLGNHDRGRNLVADASNAGEAVGAPLACSPGYDERFAARIRHPLLDGNRHHRRQRGRDRELGALLE
jgi:hypothetical protein